jgi:hypothetical protein
MNPNIPIYGLYGGEESEFESYNQKLSEFFEHNYCIRNKSGLWKWKNSDLVYALWFKDIGNEIDFDSVVVLEWDLIFLEPIDVIYSHVHPLEVGLTGLTPLSEIEDKWYWTKNPEQRKNWLQLLEFVKKEFGYADSPFASLCPGVVLPKLFLKKYSKLKIPTYGHDELRIPLFAQILGFKLVDLEFQKKWFSKRERKYFNCNDLNISTKTIQNEVSRVKGRRVFHPFRELISLSFPELISEKEESKI